MVMDKCIQSADPINWQIEDIDLHVCGSGNTRACNGVLGMESGGDMLELRLLSVQHVLLLNVAMAFQEPSSPRTLEQDKDIPGVHPAHQET
jgi:hypothetical protein